MERERRDCYNENSEPTGETYFKGDKLPEGRYPMVVMIVIQNSKGEFLMQKRVPEKGGDWGVTGGHPKSGETPLEGMITEVKEELGLDISDKTLEIYSEGCDGVDCYKMYYVNLDFDAETLDIQKEELTEARWFSMDKLEEMVETKELNPNQIACFVKCKNYLTQKAKQQ